MSAVVSTLWRRGAFVAAKGGLPPADAGDRWVSGTVVVAVRLTQLGAATLVQIAFLFAALAHSLSAPAWIPICAHLVVAGAGVIVLGQRMHPAAFMALLYSVLALDYVVALEPDGSLFVLAFIVVAQTSTMPILLYRGAVPVLSSAVVSIALGTVIVVAHPGWKIGISLASVTASLTMCAVAFLLMRTLRRFSAWADERGEEAAHERRRVSSVQASEHTMMEASRVLHDTVINTLASLSASCSVSYEPEDVRDRCRRDISRVEEALGVRTDGTGRFLDFSGLGLVDVRLTGMTGDELNRLEALLAPETASALHGCVLELVRNATKHSGEDHVELLVALAADQLVVEVSDGGRGFDGEITAGRGLAESVFARAVEHDIRVRLWTQPNRGTRVRLEYRLVRDPSPSEEGTASADAVIDGMLRRACWVWAGAIVGSGLVAETVNRQGTLTIAHAMLAIVGVLSALAWYACRGGKPLPLGLAIAIVVAAPLTLVMASSAVDFSGADALLFQAAGLTPLPVILLVTASRWWPYVLSLGLVGAAAVVVAIEVGLNRGDPELVAAMLVPAVLLTVECLLFYGLTRRVGTHLSDLWRQLVLMRFEIATRSAADAGRSRWNAAGLDASIELLRAIAEGRMDANDPVVRRRCGEEERYLRQITTLPADTPLLNWWLAIALANARSRHVGLRVQAGVADVPLELTDDFGRLVLAVLDGAAQGADLVASVLPHQGAPRLFIVGTALRVDLGRLRGLAGSCDVLRSEAGIRTVIEAFPRPTAAR